jgi:hypothetical protein
MDTSSDGREGVSLLQQGVDTGCRLMKNWLNYFYYNSVYRGESQSEYGAFVV